MPKAVKLHWQRWDDEYLVYNTASGATHLLNEVGAQALKILQVKPVNAEALSGYLVDRFQIESPENFRESVCRLLSEFSSLGLIDTAPQ